MFSMTSSQQFRKMAKPGLRVPIVAEIANSLQTPVALYRHFVDEPYSFLLESAERGEKWGRFSFIGIQPSVVFKSFGNTIEIIDGGISRKSTTKDPLTQLRKILHRYRSIPKAGAVPFWGGAVGLISYDMVRFFEKLPSRTKTNSEGSDLFFILPEILLIVDNHHQTLKVVYDARIDSKKEIEAVYDRGCREIEKVLRRLQQPFGKKKKKSVPLEWKTSLSQPAFEEKVRKIRDYIAAGDVTQTVLSIRRESPSSVDPLDLYESLRAINPSPYMFLLKYGATSLVGASPETMVRLEEGEMCVRPIAGTRPRGKDEAEDRRLAEELLADDKERAEHIMLVDLGRNDLGRVAEKGTVQVDELMAVERYSHVMHIVSNVRARLAAGKDAFDLLRATFPAGTLSGSPKIRAMEIIEELEPVRRGFYGGAVGYFGFSGNMDLAITIRSALLEKGKITVPSGAGIVADSDPKKEYQECENKAKAMMKAVEQCS